MKLLKYFLKYMPDIAWSNLMTGIIALVSIGFGIVVGHFLCPQGFLPFLPSIS